MPKDIISKISISLSIDVYPRLNTQYQSINFLPTKFILTFKWWYLSEWFLRVILVLLSLEQTSNILLLLYAIIKKLKENISTFHSRFQSIASEWMFLLSKKEIASILQMFLHFIHNIKHFSYILLSF
jgi:hypothetical protein